MIIQIIATVLSGILTIAMIGYGIFLLKQSKRMTERKYVFIIEEDLSVKEFKKESLPIKHLQFSLECAPVYETID